MKCKDFTFESYRALLLKQDTNEDDIAERMKDFDEVTSVAGKADNAMAELIPQIQEEDSPGKDSRFRVKVKDRSG